MDWPMRNFLRGCFMIPGQQQPLLVVISGPSGAGKDSLVQQLKALWLPFHFVVTTTSRPPRPNEVHGVDYYFVSEEQFQRYIAEGELLEYALVYGQYKGIHKAQIREALRSGKDVIMRLDVQGAATVRRLVPDAVLIFLTAEEEELRRRLEERQTDSPEQIERRLARAREEMELMPTFDYVVVNRYCHLERAVDQVLAIITAEHCRTHPRKITL